MDRASLSTWPRGAARLGARLASQSVQRSKEIPGAIRPLLASRHAPALGVGTAAGRTTGPSFSVQVGWQWVLVERYGESHLSTRLARDGIAELGRRRGRPMAVPALGQAKSP